MDELSMQYLLNNHHRSWTPGLQDGKSMPPGLVHDALQDRVNLDEAPQHSRSLTISELLLKTKCSANTGL